MKERHTGKASADSKAKSAATDWKRLGSLSDREIRRAVEDDPEAAHSAPGEYLAADLHRSLCARNVAPVAVHVLRGDALGEHRRLDGCVGVTRKALHRVLLVYVGQELLLEERKRDIPAAVGEVVLEVQVDGVGDPGT